MILEERGAPIRRIFLDLDGVLRRDNSPREKRDAYCVALFEATVLASADARVVIASTWRLMFSLDTLRASFSPDFARRIEGATPQLRTVTLNEIRRAEVKAYLENAHAFDDPWIAVEDKPALYGPGAPVLATDPNRGFDDECASALARWLAAAQ